MLIPILITGGILGVLALSAREAPPVMPAPGQSPMRLPDPQTSSDVMPGMAVEGRTIRIDPDFGSETVQARVGDTISMHGVSRQSEFNPGGYVVSAPPGLVQQTGPNHFLLSTPGQLTITWAPNYSVTVTVR